MSAYQRNAVHDVKVTQFDAQGGKAIRFEWIDSAGAKCAATRFGMSADHLIAAHHTAAMYGEACEKLFLIGFVKGISDGGGLD